MKLEFPQGFLWGSATSAHQVEGGNHNDWSVWELKNANRLASEALRKNNVLNPPSPYLPAEAALQALQAGEGEGKGVRLDSPLDPRNYISGRACDHYNRFREDFDIAKQLGHNAHRFSIEWSRIEPEEGRWNEKEIAHYQEVINALRERGIEPFVTLWHWTHPIWFAKRGGWAHKDAEKSFLKFVEIAVRKFSDVKYWIVLNEPETFVRHAYLLKPFGMGRPPEKFNLFLAYRVLRKLARVHASAYQLIHKMSNRAEVGFAESLVYFEPYNRRPHNILLKNILEWWRNQLFVPRIIDRVDFIGLNYYFHTRVRFNPFKSRWAIQYNEDKEVGDFGWEIYPEGIYHVLKDLKKYNKPIYITENGVADAQDVHREKFIKEHLRWVHKAIGEGIDVRGYFYWSLLDNFEWSDGFWPRFGLMEMDYETMERKIRPSALEYAKIATENAVDMGT